MPKEPWRLECTCGEITEFGPALSEDETYVCGGCGVEVPPEVVQHIVHTGLKLLDTESLER